MKRAQRRRNEIKKFSVKVSRWLGSKVNLAKSKRSRVLNGHWLGPKYTNGGASSGIIVGLAS